MNKKNNFLQYLEDTFYDQLHKELLRFICKSKDSLIVDRFDLNDAYDIEIDDVGLSSVYIDAKDEDTIEFDVQCNPEITYTELSGSYKNRIRESSGTTALWVTIYCKAKVGSMNDSFQIIGVEEFNKSKPKKPLSGNLVPIISSKEYEKYAEEILNKYYPEALKGDNPVNPELLANRMGFNVIRRRIAKSKSIFGQIYFANSKVKLFNDEIGDYEVISIPANTIIVDSSTNLDYSYGCENITIAHECVHGYLHKKAFRFAKLYNKELQGLMSCTINGGIRHINSDAESSYMESQANGIAPCLLLPKNKVISMFESKKNGYLVFTPNLLEAEELAMLELADELKVTKYALKKRLIDFGYEDLIGVYNYIDGHYLNRYSFKRGSLKSNETFTISFNDLVEMIHKGSPALFSELIKGCYVFVDNHLCLNDDKYVVKDANSSLVLTPYALHHMDECCLKFACKSQIIRNTDVLMYCYLSRGAINLGMDLDFLGCSNLSDPEVAEKMRLFNELFNDVMKNTKSMTFREAVDYILKMDDRRINEITDDPNDSSSLDVRQFTRYKNGETRALSKGVLVAMCLSLDIPPLLSNQLIELAGVKFTNSKEDSMLLTLLTTGRGHKFDDINAMLEMGGYPRITNPRK